MLVFAYVIAPILGKFTAELYNQHFAEQQNEQSAAEKPKSKYDDDPVSANRVFDLVNQERVNAGIHPLVMDERLMSSAQDKADDMKNRNYYGHEDPDGVRGYLLARRKVGSDCVTVSENISAGDRTNNEAVRGWMKSEPHHQAILNPQYSLSGVGVASEQNDPSASHLDYHYYVQHFCSQR
ncbi:CAP domain-containing protein [Candidatus Saccharibacteria bacterium]|jgi:uncharacterized protein YkwD|nr:CAP domain-containing protein [Candidatus Saccharibacteria bacterium]